MPVRKNTNATEPTTDKRLTEDTWVVCDVQVLTGTYYITADDEDVNLQDVWFAPEGVQSLDSDQIRLIDKDLQLDQALIAVGRLVAKDLKDLPTTPQPKKAAAKKATAAKAPAKKAAVKRAPAKKTAPARTPAKKVAAKKATPPAKRVVRKAAAK